jgi:hypothetical protein
VGGPGGSSSSRRAASPVPLHWSPAHQTACQGRAKRRPCLRARPPPRGCTPPQQGTQRPSSLTCAAGVDASCGVRYSTASHAVRASRGWIFSSLASCAAASSDSCSCLEAAAAASAAPASLLLAAPAERRGCAAAAAAAAASAAAPAAPTAAAAMSVSHLQPRMASTSIFSRTRCRLSDGSSASAHAVPQPPHGHVGVLFHPPAPCCHAGHPPPPPRLVAMPAQPPHHTPQHQRPATVACWVGRGAGAAPQQAALAASAPRMPPRPSAHQTSGPRHPAPLPAGRPPAAAPCRCPPPGRAAPPALAPAAAAGTWATRRSCTQWRTPPARHASQHTPLAACGHTLPPAALPPCPARTRHENMPR